MDDEARPTDEVRPIEAPAEDAATLEARRLTEQLRRILNRLVLVRPDAADLTIAVEAAREFADRLDALPERTSAGEIAEAGLFPRRFVERSPLSGLSNALAPPMTMRIIERDGEDAYIEGEVTFGPAYEGPPGNVHGGYLAAMFDELLGFAQLSPGFTGTLTVRYRKKTPLNRELSLRAGVDSVDGRKRVVRGTCSVDGEVVCEAQGLFIAPRPAD